ncbi:hypothetical protein JCM10207_000635 [Rhodosporidiobolus poonsookiae]
MKVSSLLSSLAFAGSLVLATATADTTASRQVTKRNLDADNAIAIDAASVVDSLVKAAPLERRTDEGFRHGDGDEDWDGPGDGCPRRFHRNRFGRCVPNRGGGGCWRGYRRNRWGFCVPDRGDYDDDDWRGGPRGGHCPRDFSPSGRGDDGFSLDFDGNGPPDWVPDGWAYFGREIGWAPYSGWIPSPTWRPPVVFLKIVVRVTWWTPSSGWISYWTTRWQWFDIEIPDRWNFSPRRRGGGGGGGCRGGCKRGIERNQRKVLKA